MKSRFTLLGIIAAVVLGICAIISSCTNDLNDVITYSGQVVYLKTTTPFPNLAVKVTNGAKIHCQDFTDESGFFKLKVKVNEIDGSYYLLAGDSTCIPAKVALGGYGQAEVDLGVIEVEGPALPVVVTHQVSSLTADGAVCGGEVTSAGRLKVTARGICYGKEVYPEVSDLHTKDGEGLGEFTSTLKDLEHNTIYYARAYATNSMGTAYGEQVKFTTEEGVPVVVTDSVIRITANSARCKGHVESDGGYQVTKRGTCWSTYPDPTIDDECTDNGSGLGEFSSNLTNLQRDTKYYVRTFATNSTATVYGEQLTFTTLDGLATVNTSQATTTATSINVSCEVTDDGGFTVTERGICFSSVNAEPSIEDRKVEYGRGKGNYNVFITDLTAATTYYVRAYAINENGSAYGKVLSVTTKDGMASITLGAAKNITALTASCDVKVTDAGGATLQSCGICWSTMPNPTIENNKANGGAALNTNYFCNMTDLAPATTYYVRGYATTDITTSYSAQMTFQTQSGLPVVQTDSVTANSVSITGYGNVTSDAGYNITARGVCYSTSNSTPTIADSYTTAGVGTGSFSSIVTNVLLSTTYYVRTYATNSIGTGYGNVVVITTGNGLPSVTTTIVGENVTNNTAIGGGNITDDGGYAITARGVCWNTLPNPTINDAITLDGSGSGYYSSSITGIDLTGTIIYYVRAYATNVNGTSYGRQVIISKENIDYKKLPTINYGGYTYRIYKDVGDMTWEMANTTCDNLEYGGYDDWVLPDDGNVLKYIMGQITSGWKQTDGTSFKYYSENNKQRDYDYRVPVKESAHYWTSANGPNNMYITCYYAIKSEVGYGYISYWNIIESDNSNSQNSCRVRPIRKYLTNQ